MQLVWGMKWHCWQEELLEWSQQSVRCPPHPAMKSTVHDQGVTSNCRTTAVVLERDRLRQVHLPKSRYVKMNTSTINQDMWGELIDSIAQWTYDNTPLWGWWWYISLTEHTLVSFILFKYVYKMFFLKYLYMCLFEVMHEENVIILLV